MKQRWLLGVLAAVTALQPGAAFHQGTMRACAPGAAATLRRCPAAGHGAAELRLSAADAPVSRRSAVVGAAALLFAAPLPSSAAKPRKASNGKWAQHYGEPGGCVDGTGTRMMGGLPVCVWQACMGSCGWSVQSESWQQGTLLIPLSVLSALFPSRPARPARPLACSLCALAADEFTDEELEGFSETGVRAFPVFVCVFSCLALTCCLAVCLCVCVCLSVCVPPSPSLPPLSFCVSRLLWVFCVRALVLPHAMQFARNSGGQLTGGLSHLKCIRRHLYTHTHHVGAESGLQIKDIEEGTGATPQVKSEHCRRELRYPSIFLRF